MSYLGPKVYIDLHQLKKNYQIVKSEVGEIPIMATVKANAYGHGAVEVSKALEEEGVRYLAVFTIDEGIELRDAGIKTDIFGNLFCIFIISFHLKVYYDNITFIFFQKNIKRTSTTIFYFSICYFIYHIH